MCIREKLESQKLFVPVQENSIRVSPHLYNDQAELDLLAAILTGQV